MSKHLIYIVSIDHDTSQTKTSNYSEYCINTWKYWCSRNNVDLIVNTTHDSRLGRPIWNKELIYDIGKNYEKIGIVDSDTMIRWDAPNIFASLGEEFAGLIDNADLRWVINSLDVYSSTFFLDWKRPQLNEYFNAGVLFFHNKYLDVFKQVLDFYFDNQDILDNWDKGGGREQTILNYFLVKNQVKRKELLPEWNLISMHKKDMFKYNWQLQEDMTPFFIKYAYIWHFTGFDPINRERLMNETWNFIKQYYE